MENKDGVPRGKRLSRFAGQDHTTTTAKGMTSVVDRHRFYAEPYPKNVGKAAFFYFYLHQCLFTFFYYIFLVSVIM